MDRVDDGVTTLGPLAAAITPIYIKKDATAEPADQLAKLRGLSKPR
jgi:hypothetical protein